MNFQFSRGCFPSTLPDKLKNNEINPVVTYQLGKMIKNKILNYKEAVNFIYVYEDVSFCLNTDQCHCAISSFWDPHHHKHTITGDLRILKNNKLRELLTKGPNYREPRTINFSSALIEITTTPDACIKAMALKTKRLNLKLNHGKRKY